MNHVAKNVVLWWPFGLNLNSDCRSKTKENNIENVALQQAANDHC